MTWFWILWGFDAIISLVVLYFFFIGLADGSITSFNIRLWLLLLAIVAGVMAGSLLLKAGQHLSAAKGVLCIMAVPGLLYLLFFLMMILFNPRWN